MVAHTDPFPAVAGQGIARLRTAGIEVVLADDTTAQRFKDLNIGFLSRVERGRPWVRMKIAASLDGRTALNDGRSQWITGSEARIDGHLWRKRAGAILTGIGTVLADDPRLDVRLVVTDLQPVRVIVDSAMRTPPTARIVEAPGRCLVVAAAQASEREAALRSAGAEVLHLPGNDGQVDLAALTKYLASAGVNELHVEAGSRLNGELLRARLVDELIVYLAPMFVGPGRTMADLAGLESLDNAAEFRFYDVQHTGSDLRLQLRRLVEDA